MGYEARRDEVCMAASSNISIETANLQLLITQQNSENNDLIESFLFLADADGQAGGAALMNYRDSVLVTKMVQAISDGDIDIADAMTASTNLPAVCDQDAMVAFNQAAGELAQAQTLGRYADFLQDDLCTTAQTTFTDAAIADTTAQPDSEAMVNSLISSLFAEAQADGFTGTEDDFRADQMTAFAMDTGFTPSPVGAPLVALPLGYCPASAYDAFASATIAREAREADAFFAEWLKAEQECDEWIAIVMSITGNAADNIANLETLLGANDN